MLCHGPPDRPQLVQKKQRRHVRICAVALPPRGGPAARARPGEPSAAACAAAAFAAPLAPGAPHVLAPQSPAALQLQQALLRDGALGAAGALAHTNSGERLEKLPPVLPDVLLFHFEKKLEADLSSVGLTLAAVTGVIIYWRGVWSLLDVLVGDSVLGDLCCMAAGLTLVLWLRLSGAKVTTSFWPPG
ncbi:MAG: hypothetical protein J3K34DRAFT_462122 [Monoraphidium minutum]|nr:MAG: hypothetical protein J3K34DRAFT_462122 [Monoraphidium minutum]